MNNLVNLRKVSAYLAEILIADGRTLPAGSAHRRYIDRIAAKPPTVAREHIVDPGKMLRGVDRPLTADTTSVFVFYADTIYYFIVLRTLDGHVVLPLVAGEEPRVFPWRYHVSDGKVSTRVAQESSELPKDFACDLYSLARAGIEHGTECAL